MNLKNVRRVVWIDPVSGLTLTYATMPMSATPEVKLDILARVRASVRKRDGEASAMTVRLST